MQNVSNDFKNQIIQPKTIDAKIIIGQNEITSDDINNIKRTWNSSLFKTITKMIDVDTNTPIEKDTIIEPQFGLYINDAFEYVSLGKYKVHDEPVLNKDTNSYQSIAYDKIVESMVNYELLDTEITYPCTVRQLFVAIFTKLNWNISGIPISFVNSSSIIQEDVFSKTNMTYRDVLDELCTISCNFLIDIDDTPTLIDKNLLATISTKTGTNIHITDAKNEQIGNISLKGDTQQDGTPTPSTPIPINVVTGDNTIEICGKNLLNNNAIVKGRLDNGVIGYESNVTNLETTDNTITFTTNAKYRGVTSDFIDISLYSNYTYLYFMWESGTTTPKCSVSYYDSAKQFISNNSGYGITNGLRYPNNVENAKYVRLYINLDTAGTQTITKPQFRFGNSAPTSYEPYTGQNYPVYLGELELCKIGDYQDSIFYNTTDTNLDLNSWYIKKEIGSVTLDGTTNPLYGDGGSSNDYWEYSRTDMIGGNGIQANVFTNYFNQTTNSRVVIIPNGGLYLRFPKSSGIDVSSNTLMNNWLSTHNTIVKYVLSTPTYTKITDTELIGQLESVKLLNGVNNITISSSNLASPITIGYVSDVETINEEYMSDTSVEIRNQVFFNSLVFSRASDSDNIFRKDDDSINANGLHEFKVRDLQILSLNWRDNFIDEMWNYIKKFKYYAYDVNTNGITYLEPIDGFYLSTFGETYPTLLLNSDLAIGNGVNEKIYANEPVESATEYKYADTTDRKINQAYLIVDKQNSQIQALTQTTSNLSSTEATHYQEMLSKMDDKASISDIETITNQVNVLQTDTYTKTEINKILNGTDESGNVVSFLQTLSATLDENGMSYNKTGANTSSNINETGVTVTNKKNNSELLFAGYDEEKLEALVRVANLYLTRFLGLDVWRIEIINDPTNGKGLGFFYIG